MADSEFHHIPWIQKMVPLDSEWSLWKYTQTFDESPLPFPSWNGTYRVREFLSLVTSCAGLREEEPQTAYPMSLHGSLIQLLASSLDVKLYPIIASPTQQETATGYCHQLKGSASCSHGNHCLCDSHTRKSSVLGYRLVVSTVSNLMLFGHRILRVLI